MTIYEKLVFDLYDLRKNHTVRVTSKGNQQKWRVDGIWLKENAMGYEGIAEHLATVVLQASKLPTDSYVHYTACTIVNKGEVVEGCVSDDFRKGLLEKTLGRLLEENGVHSKVFSGKPTEESLLALCKVIKELTDIDAEEYLRRMFALDALLLNEDRHLNNIVFLTDGDVWRFTPLFDNGMALLASVSEYSYDKPTRVHIRKVKPVLLTKDFKKHAQLYKGKPFINRKMVIDYLGTYKEELGRAGEVLKIQIDSGNFDHMFY